MVNFEEFSFKSTNGKNTIYVLKCVPNGEIKGIVQIAHGIAEHINRYKDYMEFLANNGYIAVGNDHLGHGQSIGKDYQQGFFSEKDGWKYVVQDMKKLHDIMIKEYAKAKYIMFGHSMGSFLTRTYLIQYPNDYDMAILSGTGHQSKLLVSAGNLLAEILVNKNGANSDGKQLSDIAFKGYLSRIDNPRSEFDWLSRRNDTVDKYILDPLCGFTAKSGLYRDMFQGIKIITNQNNINKMNKNKPILFMSGSEDPVGDFGKGVEKAYKAFIKAGIKDVSMKLYDGGRHEMLNEINNKEVELDILNWINSKQ